jgi:hypothetical protein
MTAHRHTSTAPRLCTVLFATVLGAAITVAALLRFYQSPPPAPTLWDSSCGENPLAHCE